MTRDVPRLLLLVLTLTTASGCQRDGAKKEDWKSFAAPSSSKLDGMQLDSARRVAIESASAAMARHDLERLKQLSAWVRGRAQVVILEPDDLEALDLAIACLGQPGRSANALARLDAIHGGKLKVPARAACEGGTSP